VKGINLFGALDEEIYLIKTGYFLFLLVILIKWYVTLLIDYFINQISNIKAFDESENS